MAISLERPAPENTGPKSPGSAPGSPEAGILSERNCPAFETGPPPEKTGKSAPDWKGLLFFVGAS